MIKMADRHFDALEMVKDACVRLEINLISLIAETALWAHPETHHRQLRKHGSAAVYPGIRRLRPGQGEKRGVVNGAGLDDNSYANNAIKRSLGLPRTKIVGYECCHVWADSCYDTRYHTAIANLVLIPRALASLADHDPGVMRALKYRAYELYDWHPDEQPIPEKPAAYTHNWRQPEPDPGISNSTQSGPVAPNERPVSIDKIWRWASNPTLNVHRIIGIVSLHGPFSREQLVQRIERLGISRNPYGAVASLMTNRGNAYGLVFVERSGLLHLHPALEGAVRRSKWQNE
jgi:hypothetical protein